jgi:hypothetical protein
MPRANFVAPGGKGETQWMSNANGQDLEMCADLLETVARQLGNADDPLSATEAFESVTHQSKELLLDLSQRIEETVRLGQLDPSSGARNLALLEDILQPLLQGQLRRPDELGMLYLRMAKVLRGLAKAPEPTPADDDETTIFGAARNRP